MSSRTPATAEPAKAPTTAGTAKAPATAGTAETSAATEGTVAAHAAARTSPDAEPPATDAAPRRRRRAWLALALTVVALVILGALVRYEVQQMSLIVDEVCSPPRTSWVPFLHNNLLACIA